MANQPTLKLSRWTDRTAALVLASAAVVFVTIFFTLAAWKYANFRYTAMDLAIFTQTVAETSRGNWFGNTIHPPSYLGDHFSPLLALLTLPYRVLPHPLTLVVLLQAALAAGVWPVYRLARAHLSVVPSIAVGLAYLASPFTQNLGLFEFHFIAFAVPLLLAAAAAYQRQAWPAFLGWTIASLLVREDVALVVAGFALLAGLERRPARWIIGPAALAVFWLAGALGIIGLMAQAGGYKFSLYYAWLGESPQAVLQTLALHPGRVLLHFFRLGNLELILGLLLPLAFLPLLTPRTLLLALTPLAQIMLGAPGGSELILKTQYSALFLPGLWLAFTRALGRIRREGIARPRWLHRAIGDRGLVTIILVTAVIYGSLTLGPLPGTVTSIARQGWRTTESRWQAALVAQVPPDATVAASYALLPAVAARPKVASLNYAFIGRQQLSRLPYELPHDTDYLLVDLEDFLTYQLQYQRHFLYAPDYPSAAARLREQLTRLGLAPTVVADHWVLFARQPTPRIALYEIFDQALPDLNGEALVRENGVEFLGWRHGQPALGPILAEAQLPLTFYWRAARPPVEPIYLQLQTAGQPLTPLLPLGAGLFPVSDWPRDKAVATNFWFTLPTTELVPDDPISLQLFTVQNGGLYLTPDLGTETRITASTKIGAPIPLGTPRELKAATKK